MSATRTTRTTTTTTATTTTTTTTTTLQFRWTYPIQIESKEAGIEPMTSQSSGNHTKRDTAAKARLFSEGY